MHHHLVELQRKLIEAQGIDKNSIDRIRSYTASVRCQKDIESLKRIGLTTGEVSRSLDVPVSFVKRQLIRIAQNNEERRRFLRTGIIPVSDPGVCQADSILQESLSVSIRLAVPAAEHVCYSGSI
jgi:hypothetical protein